MKSPENFPPILYPIPPEVSFKGGGGDEKCLYISLKNCFFTLIQSEFCLWFRVGTFSLLSGKGLQEGGGGQPP